ncbi:MAG: hypothetical protein ACTSRI_11240 [Promethearchaeota archaeon]
MSGISKQINNTDLGCPFYRSCILPKNDTRNCFIGFNICYEYQLKKKKYE